MGKVWWAPGDLKRLPQAGVRRSRPGSFANCASRPLWHSELPSPHSWKLPPTVVLQRLTNQRLTNAVSSRTSEPYRDCPDSQATSRDPHGDSRPALDLADDSIMPSPAHTLTRSAPRSPRTRSRTLHDRPDGTPDGHASVDFADPPRRRGRRRAGCSGWSAVAGTAFRVSPAGVSEGIEHVAGPDHADSRSRQPGFDAGRRTAEDRDAAPPSRSSSWGSGACPCRRRCWRGDR